MVCCHLIIRLCHAVCMVWLLIQRTGVSSTEPLIINGAGSNTICAYNQATLAAHGLTYEFRH